MKIDLFLLKIQSTPDNPNLQGKLKKVRVIGSLEQMTRNKEKTGLVMHCSEMYPETNEPAGLTRLVNEVHEKRQGLHGCFKINVLFWTTIRCLS